MLQNFVSENDVQSFFQFRKSYFFIHITFYIWITNIAAKTTDFEPFDINTNCDYHREK